jgi:hypothetical protein
LGTAFVGLSVAVILPAYLGRAWVFQCALIIYGLLVFGSLCLIAFHAVYARHYFALVATLIVMEGLFGAYMGLAPSDRDHFQAHLAGLVPLLLLLFVGYTTTSRRLDARRRPDDPSEPPH